MVGGKKLRAKRRGIFLWNKKIEQNARQFIKKKQQQRPAKKWLRKRVPTKSCKATFCVWSVGKNCERKGVAFFYEYKKIEQNARQFINKKQQQKPAEKWLRKRVPTKSCKAIFCVWSVGKNCERKGVAFFYEHKKIEQELDNFFPWLGWQDLNLRMRESKSRALPLGYTPMLL